jgi:hypothetical protein
VQKKQKRRTGHGGCVLEAGLGRLEGRRHLKHRLAVLLRARGRASRVSASASVQQRKRFACLRGDVACGEGAPVAQAAHGVHERRARVARQQKVRVQAARSGGAQSADACACAKLPTMRARRRFAPVHRQRVGHRAAGGHQRLADELRGAARRALAPKAPRMRHHGTRAWPPNTRGE